MNKEAIFSAWAPANSVWAPWVKPVLFAHLDTALGSFPPVELAPQVSGLAAPTERVVVVIDLPGAQSATTGIALAHRGYQPVPLYNAVPSPTNVPLRQTLAHRPVAAVDVLPIMQVLRAGAAKLAALQICGDAPPAFLLDANRHGDGRKMLPDEFDNRSICFTTDFPSANFLIAHGFQRVLLVQQRAVAPQTDLTHVLRRWQDGGLQLERMGMDAPGKSERFEVAKPAWYRAMFQRTLATFGLRRANTGGFGAWVPDAAAGG